MTVALIGVFLMLSLSSCDRAVRVETIKLLPPQDLLQDCLKPPFEGGSYRDLAEYALDLRGYLDSCNIDKRLLREWAEEP